MHIERLSKGVYLATSDDAQGLIPQGRAIQEALEFGFMESQAEADDGHLRRAAARFGLTRPLRFPNHTGDKPEGTLRAILKQADIEQEVFLRQ